MSLILRTGKWLVVSPIPLLIGSLVLNCVLATTVLSTRRAVQTLKEGGRLQPGTVAQDFDVTTTDGRPVRLSFRDQPIPTVLYVMRPSCVWCARNNDNFQAVARAAGGEFRLVVVSLANEGVDDYRRKHNIDTDILTNIPPPIMESYRMGGTPQTILISRDGKVVKSWMGAYTGETLTEVQSELRVVLPGVPSPPPATAKAGI